MHTHTMRKKIIHESCNNQIHLRSQLNNLVKKCSEIGWAKSWPLTYLRRRCVTPRQSTTHTQTKQQKKGTRADLHSMNMYLLTFVADFHCALEDTLPTNVPHSATLEQVLVRTHTSLCMCWCVIRVCTCTVCVYAHPCASAVMQFEHACANRHAHKICVKRSC